MMKRHVFLCFLLICILLLSGCALQRRFETPQAAIEAEYGEVSYLFVEGQDSVLAAVDVDGEYHLRFLTESKRGWRLKAFIAPTEYSCLYEFDDCNAWVNVYRCIATGELYAVFSVDGQSIKIADEKGESLTGFATSADSAILYDYLYELPAVYWVGGEYEIVLDL